MRLEMKTFLSHKHCQALMDIWWRQRAMPHGSHVKALTLRAEHSMPYIAFLALAPLLNEYIEARRLEKTQTPETPPKPCGRSRLRL